MIGQNLQNTRKDCFFGGSDGLYLFKFNDVSFEVVAQVIDNISVEDPDAQLLGQLGGVRSDFDVEGQDDGVFFEFALEHDRGAHDVSLVKRSKADAGDWDLL